MRKLLSVGICGVLLAGSALGHAKLVAASPAADAQLTSAPGVLTLTFNENVKLAVLKLTSAGHDVPLSLDRGAAPSPTVKILLPPLAAGTYDVQWSALTIDDGHVVKGAYSFVVR